MESDNNTKLKKLFDCNDVCEYLGKVSRYMALFRHFPQGMSSHQTPAGDWYMFLTDFVLLHRK